MDTTAWRARETVMAKREMARAVNELRYFRACLIGTWLKPNRRKAACEALKGPCDETNGYQGMEWRRAIAKARSARARLNGLALV